MTVQIYLSLAITLSSADRLSPHVETSLVHDVHELNRIQTPSRIMGYDPIPF